MKNSYLGVVLILFVTLFSCESKKDNDSVVIESMIESTRDRIENNFRYKVLSWQGNEENIVELATQFNQLKIAKEGEKIAAINTYIKKYGLEEDLINGLPSLDIVELLILHKIERELNSEISFSTLKPIVFKKSESKKEIVYNIGLFATDEAFNPTIQLLFNDDTANIDINEVGLGYFTVLKNTPDETHNFEGIIQYCDIKGTLKTLPFTFE